MNVNNNVTLQMGFFLMLESQTVSNNVDRNVMMPVHHLICVNLKICVAACLWVIDWFFGQRSFLGQRPFLDCPFQSRPIYVNLNQNALYQKESTAIIRLYQMESTAIIRLYTHIPQPYHSLIYVCNKQVPTGIISVLLWNMTDTWNSCITCRCICSLFSIRQMYWNILSGM